MTADHRSVLPSVPGVPWWGAIAVALFATAIGIAFDGGSGSRELSGVYTTFYVLGCVIAVLVVEQAGVFTAVIQPPLILFCTVPGAYWLLHGGRFTGVKNIAINCGYPLIERFPLMLFTSATVLLIGMVRWYLGMGAQTTTDTRKTTGNSDRRPTAFARLGTLISAAINRNTAHGVEAAPARERRSGDRPRRATAESRAAARRNGRQPARSGSVRSSANRAAGRGSARPDRAGADRSRHVRPPIGDAADLEYPRRRRLDPNLNGDQPPRRRRPVPREEEQLPRRRPRPAQDADRTGQPPRPRRSPHPTTGRSTNRNDWEAAPEPRPRRRQAPLGSNGSSPTHHPISQVRYRRAAGDDSVDEPRRRPPDRGDFESWEYDI